MQGMRVLALPNIEVRLVASVFTAIERRPDDPNQFLAVIPFHECDHNGRPLDSLHPRRTVRLPLPMIGMVRPYSCWVNQSYVGLATSPGQSTIRLNRDRFESVGDVAVNLNPNQIDYHRQIHDVMPLTPKPSHRSAGMCLLARRKSHVIVLPCPEIARFYFGAFSVVLGEAVASFMRTGDFRELYDEKRSHLSGRTVHLVPSWRLRDRASALQLALLVAEPDLRDLLLMFFRQVIKQVTAGTPSDFVLPLPARCGELALSCAGPTKCEPVPGIGARQLRAATLIVSDNRSARFDEVVVNRGLVHALDPDEQDRTWDEVFHLEQNRVGADTEFTVRSKGAGDARRATLPAPWQSFRAAFPAYRHTQVQYAGSPRLYVPKRRYHPVWTPTEFCVFGAKRAGGALRRLLIVPDPAPLPPPVPTEYLFLDDPIAPPSEMIVRVSNLPSPLRQFVLAKRELGREGWASGFGAASDEEILYSMPAAWGRFAMRRDSTPRAFAVCGLLVFGEAHVYAIDFERSRGSYLASIGLVARRDNARMTMDQLFACVAAATGRISSFGDVNPEDPQSGIWPSAAKFRDVKSVSLKHYARHRASPYTLANDLMVYAERLAAMA